MPGSPLLDPAAFGERLRAARTRAGLKQSELAERAGIGKRALENYESGARIPRTAVPELARVLEVEPDWLLYGERRTTYADLANLGELVERLGELETVLRDTLVLAERQWSAFRQHLRALDERLGALEVLLERDLDLDERIAAVLDVKSTGGAAGTGPNRPAAPSTSSGSGPRSSDELEPL
jgi:transcriptional regulator with XRE-family HTH domain